ncbi:ComEA family DNA-binding protein [Winogradskyella alexanderae]|uniref:Helix-hairpin-helix domain-containing protein n=1 Tax=Winogradskyella alexanderae TaxID=2877123 RepID=A0ABS7XTR8_9FLAO|nr:helix-hairpin-helix domain-containing protein [Winogradskyella alexanderae]MCA0132833.1 helix-hairpin-helix domain-containing protein [Winogradskyella alexanderae]
MVPYFTEKQESFDSPIIDTLRSEIDSLKVAKLEENKTTIYPFNPNYITDFKGYSLGMSNEEIDRLHEFRSKNQWVNSASQFQKVTNVSDSLLAEISPYFKFPEWVNKPKKQYSNTYLNQNTTKTFEQKIDLNKATKSQLQKVYGVGEKLSERIITYRNRLVGGFHSEIELTEVHGLTDEVIENIKKDFVVKTPRTIVTYNLNTASKDDLVLIKYVDYEIASNIIEERTLRDGFKSLEELTKVEDFPLNKYEIIKLYLHL